MQSVGYQNYSYVKQFHTDNMESEVHYFMHLRFPEEKIRELIQTILSDTDCGKIYRVKGTLPANDGTWWKVNATTEKIEMTSVKDGQAVWIVIGDHVSREKIDAHLLPYNTDPEYVSI